MKKIKFFLFIVSCSFLLVSFLGYLPMSFPPTSKSVAYASAPTTGGGTGNWTSGLDPDAKRTWGDLITVARNILNILLLLFGSVATLMIIWGGVVYIISSGNPEKTEQAKKIITYAIIGIIIVTSTWLLIGLTANIISSTP